MYLLGYIARDNAIYLADKDVNVSAYRLSLSVVEYQTVVLRGDMETAAQILERDIADSEKNKIARFLEAQGHRELALEISKDHEHRFDLALALNDLKIAETIAREADDESKWRNLGDKALENWDIGLAETCFTNAKDIESLLLIYTSTGNKDALRKIVVPAAMESGKNNIAFNALWFVGDVDGCVDILNNTHRSSEAALLALTYGGDVSGSVKLWKERLSKNGRGKIADTICDPETHPDKFPSNLGEKANTVPVHASGENDLIELDGIATPVDRATPAPTAEETENGDLVENSEAQEPPEEEPQEEEPDNDEDKS
jgi:coatomer subunit beta'